MVLIVSKFQSFQAHHREVCWVFCSSYIPAKCLSWWRTDYMPKRVIVDTSAILRQDYGFFLPIVEYCSPVWGSAAECHIQLFARQVYSVDLIRWLIVSCRCVIDVMLLDCVCWTRLIRTRFIVCSVSFHLLQPVYDIPYPLVFEVSRCRTSPFARFPAGPGSYVEWPSLQCLAPERWMGLRVQ